MCPKLIQYSKYSKQINNSDLKLFKLKENRRKKTEEPNTPRLRQDSSSKLLKPMQINSGLQPFSRNN